jgi:very-short-patch-repair endonuclease
MLRYGMPRKAGSIGFQKLKMGVEDNMAVVGVSKLKEFNNISSAGFCDGKCCLIPPLAKGGEGGFYMLLYNRNLKEYSRRLRKNMTDAEKLLWSKIKDKQMKGYQFYRQKPIGNFIVDFYCPKANLVIELDGGQHYCNEGKAKDNIRDEHIESLGLRVLRFSDREVFKNLKGILEKIWSYL